MNNWQNSQTFKLHLMSRYEYFPVFTEAWSLFSRLLSPFLLSLFFNLCPSTPPSQTSDNGGRREQHGHLRSCKLLRAIWHPFLGSVASPPPAWLGHQSPCVAGVHTGGPSVPLHGRHPHRWAISRLAWQVSTQVGHQSPCVAGGCACAGSSENPERPLTALSLIGKSSFKLAPLYPSPQIFPLEVQFTDFLSFFRFVYLF